MVSGLVPDAVSGTAIGVAGGVGPDRFQRRDRSFTLCATRRRVGR